MNSIFIKIGVIITLFVFITGCTKGENTVSIDNKNSLETVELKGIISGITDSRVLVVQNVTKEEVINNTEEENGRIAISNNASWFLVNENDMEDFKVGQQVKVIYRKNQDIMQSDPPIQDCEKIQILN